MPKIIKSKSEARAPKIEPSRIPKRAPILKIKVTEEHIKFAVRENSRSCMIAEAIKDSVPSATHVSVDVQTVRWTDRAKGLRYIYLTPPTAQIGLVQFDQGIVSKPFEFILRSAQTTSVIVQRKRDGKRTNHVAHRFGKRKFIASPSLTNGTIPETLGGKPPPAADLTTNTKAPPSITRRAFGIRALTAGNITKEANDLPNPPV